ncbi:olfactory receptor 1468-like [Paroedura picta]|uniref:olfactory receptor 1468-like n=1 Tax=Paroedura picta TaxID=143630 RepID=UPI004057AC1B
MRKENQTELSGFLLLDLSTDPEHRRLLASLFLAMYLLILSGNLLIILLIRFDAHLCQTPMYFFLSHLSLADVGFASVTIPKMLQNLLFQVKAISYSGCLVQMYSYMAFGNTDSFLLASMAYDRYLAICRPLYYTTLMSHKQCLLLVTACWALATLHSLLYTLMMSRLSFCSSREIPQFFCEIYPLLGLSCSDTSLIENTALVEGFLDVLGPFFLIVVSYVRIFYTILNVPSKRGKHKAFSTCGSHLSVVILFYGNLCWVYLQPSSRNMGKSVVPSLMYTVVTPMLNPFIYTLRNNEMKAALKRLVGRMRSFRG